MKILILGTGQSMRRDDAAGLEAVKLWQRQFPISAARVTVEIYELPGLGILDLLEGKDVAILVDAVHLPAQAGKVLRLTPGQVSSSTAEAGFAHGWGVAETLLLGKSIYPPLATCMIILIGIAGKDFRMGVGLSPEVKAVIVEASEMVEKEIQNYL